MRRCSDGRNYPSQEARAASALNHPSIVTVYDLGESEDTPFIAMELVHGKTVRELLRTGPLPPTKIIPLATQLVEGLAKAHAAGIVHRDLKPENLMVTDDGYIKIWVEEISKPRRHHLLQLRVTCGRGVEAGSPSPPSPTLLSLPSSPKYVSRVRVTSGWRRRSRTHAAWRPPANRKPAPGRASRRLLPGPPLASVWAGVLAGASLVFLADRLVPHEHFLKGREGLESRFVKRAWLFVAAIALHNLPEGLAVGVGFGGESPSTGIVITAGIILQNLPEGLIAAVSLISVGYSRVTALAIAGVTGLFELLGGVVGIATFTLVEGLVPFMLAFAGGAMLYVVCQEVIPEAYRRGVERPATWGLIAGFLIMLTLDQTLG